MVTDIGNLAENERQVWDCLSAASDGATAYELASRLDWKITSVRPRLSMMLGKGLLIISGKRKNGEYSGKNCSVYKVCPVFPCAPERREVSQPVPL